MTADLHGRETPAPVLIVSNTSWSIFNFRSGLIDALGRAGHPTFAAAPPDEYSPRLARLATRYVPLPMQNKGTSPLADLLLLVRIWRLLRRVRPVCVLTYTVKPNIYTAIAARFFGIPVVTNVAGLGSVFGGSGWLVRLVRDLYRFALRTPRTVFFQNRDDREHFIREGIVDEERAVLLPGSGVDTRRFSPPPEPAAEPAAFSFLMFGRLLGEKGVREYVDAARALKRKYPRARFRLLGFLEVENPSAISRDEVLAWVDEGCVEFHEATDDVGPHIAAADCVVLPTYYLEGTPRSLLEAASMGKPVVTTDSPGCRDAVTDGVTGYLVRPRDVADLIDKLERMLQLDSRERTEMGRRAREKMLREFDERIVIEQYLDAVRSCLAPRSSAAGGSNHAAAGKQSFK